MTTRRMTAADYAEAGVAPPPGFSAPDERGYGFWMTPDGRYMSARRRPGFTVWMGETPAPARCDECGDETGQCGCRL